MGAEWKLVLHADGCALPWRGDGTPSKFMRDGFITSVGDVAGQTQAVMINELE